MALLEVTDLRTYFRTDDGIVKAVDGVSFSVDKGQTLGIVGESGSGKSVTSLTIMGLNQRAGAISQRETVDPSKELVEALQRNSRVSALSSGTALFKGEDLLRAKPSRLRDIRGNDIAMIFQDPMTSLNPVKKIGWQLVEAVHVHKDVTRKEAHAQAVEALTAVRIPRAEQRIHDYPHQFSGGMRQRVMIAMALINEPDLVIADEPTTGLDVTTQAQILELMNQLQEERDMAIIMITHDLGVVAEVAEQVVVMYAARIAERAAAADLYERPLHPYTWGLLGSMPRLGVDVQRLAQIPGQPPSLLFPPPGCRFHPRCPYAFDRCRRELPELMPAPGGGGHLQACFLDEETKLRESQRTLASVMGAS